MTHRNKITRVKKQPAGAPVNIINQTIEVRPIHRAKQDVPDWRSAMQIAESVVPRRQMLYNLYHDTILDDQWIACWEKRTDAIKAANWRFVDKDGEEVEEINDLIDCIGFEELLIEVLNTKAWGYTMVEPKFYRNHSQNWEMTTNLIPRRHMHVESGIISYDGVSEEGIDIRTGIYTKTVMEIGNLKDLGILLPVSLPVILKRGGIGDYAMFVQVYGSPIVDAAFDGHDLEQKKQLNQSLEAMGNGGKLTRPKGTEVTLLESKTAGQEPHSKFIDVLNNAISKCTLGTTETTGSSSSSGYAQAKTHQKDDNLKKAGDIKYVRKALNSRFIKILETHGFNTQGGKFIVEAEEEEVSTKDKSDMMLAWKREGFPMDDDQIYEELGFKKPDNYDQQIAERKEQHTEPPNTPPNEPKPKKEQETNVDGKTKETEEKEVKLVDYFKKFISLGDFFLKAPALKTGAIQTMCCGNLHTINLKDSELNTEQLIQDFWNAKQKKQAFTFHSELFKYTLKTLLKAFKTGWDTDFIALSFGNDFVYGDDDPAMLTAFEQNLFRFSGTKTLAQVQALNQLFRDAKSFEDFYQRATKQIEVFNKTWLETEYNTALLTGQAAATYHRLIKQKEIFPYWRYETVGDEHVRPEHALLDGLILPADDKRWLKIFPPNGWNCRCRIVPMTKNEFDTSKLGEMKQRADDYLGSTQFSKDAAQGFGVNRAVLRKVFTANQQYIRKFPNKASKLLNKLGASDFDLQSYSNAKKQATNPTPVYNKTAEEFYDDLEILDKTKVIRDYQNRPFVVDENEYKRHINKKDDRVILLNALKDSLLHPDEVWLLMSKAEKAAIAESKGQKYKADVFNEITYVKYYNNKTIIVKLHSKNGVTEVKTWFPLIEKRKQIDNYRSGLLMYSK